MHIFHNIRNNRLTEPKQDLYFTEKSVPLVCQAFHKRTVAALPILTEKTAGERKQSMFHKSCDHVVDVAKTPWQFQCDRFQMLLGMCHLLQAVVMGTTKFNIAAAEVLPSDHQFQYVLLSAFGQNLLKYPRQSGRYQRSTFIATCKAPHHTGMMVFEFRIDSIQTMPWHFYRPS
ncbi:hypothetical protein HELRODRAFT_181114 [Helobdella robusta]|uniref:Uncharacterized protein n=1 Tax=Helobdella robusta TaxID=6412 RepID=T1FGM5_HELRO|nr:hypothetical protein HELRODRAFT_181114 [Helobdella robusta]ESN93194.1 hypothetical protein HELRODRAFT_181114 [Helobdella robusta]